VLNNQYLNEKVRIIERVQAMIKLPIIEPDLGRFESSYQHAFLKRDAFQAIFVIGLSNIASLALIRSDYQSFGSSLEFNMFLGARLAVFLISAIAIVVLSTSSVPNHHNWAVISYMIAGALINIFINAMVTPSYVAYIGVSIVLINIYYFALFTPIHIRAITANLFSAVVIFQAFQSAFSDEAKTVILGMHILANIVGLVVSARLYTHRRLSFKTHAEEAELKLELTRLASIDPLTNVKNRRIFSEKAIEEFGRAKRYNRPVSLILIDIDRLKNINDTYGHQAGDEVIRYCASVLEEQIREHDTLARLGGDEFGILLPETQLTESINVAKRIQQHCQQDFTLADGGKIVLSLSLSVTEIADGNESYEDFFRRADRMLYKAKEDGRNRLVFEESLPDEQAGA